MKTKRCAKCGEIKNANEFWKDKNRKGGLYSWCIPCTKTYKRVKKHFRTPEQTREQHLKRTYGLTLEDYDNLARLQNGVCMLCEEPESVGPRLSVDHDHKTGKVRGLLCKRCNLILGLIEKNSNMLIKIKTYLGEK